MAKLKMKEIGVVLYFFLYVSMLNCYAADKVEGIGSAFGEEKGLVAYWNFDEGKGDVAKDVSGNGNDGVINGAEWVKSKIGNALSFKEGSFVEVENTEKLILGNALTVEAWIYPEDLGDFRYIISWWGSYLLRIDPPKEGNRLSFFIFLDGKPTSRVSGIVPELNKWYHIAGVWNGTKVQIWVNGEKKDEGVRTGSVQPNDKPFTISAPSKQSFVGIIDEVKIYNRVLCETEINAHYKIQGKILPLDISQFFIEPLMKQKIDFRISGIRSGREDKIDYTLKSYNCEEVLKGKVTSFSESFSINLKLEQGYYELFFPQYSQTFGIGCLPEYKRKKDPFFCIDSALSWLEKNSKLREGLIKNLKRNGIEMSRERVWWRSINPSPNEWNWQVGTNNYEEIREFYTSQGMKILEVFHDAPSWAKDKKEEVFPSNLIATYDSWKTILKCWQNYLSALEVWNEPDVIFGGDYPAFYYIPLIKTINSAQKDEKIKLEIGGGVFADSFAFPYDDAKAEFIDDCAKSGLLDCVDFVSFHNYDYALFIENSISSFRGWFKKYNKENIPLWITEAGRPWNSGSERPAANEDCFSALDTTMKVIEAKACGVARFFPFVYPYYDRLGMMGKEVTPLRLMVCYSCAVKVLSGKEYIGDLIIENKDIKRARVFTDETETVVILFTEKLDNFSVNLPSKLQILKIENIDGSKIKFSSKNTFEIKNGLVYVWLKRRDLNGLIKKDTSAMKLYQISKSCKPLEKKTPSIVIQPLVSENLSIIKSGYLISRENSESLAISVKVNNLADTEKNVIVEIVPAQNWKSINPSSQEVKIAPLSTVDLKWNLRLSERMNFFEKQYFIARVKDRSGEELDFLSIGVKVEKDLKYYLENAKEKVKIRVDDLDRWKKDVSGGLSEIEMSITSEGNWLMNVKFNSDVVHKLVYPRFEYPQEIDFTQYDALVFRGRCKNPATVIFTVSEEGSFNRFMTPTHGSLIPADNKWHTGIVYLDRLHLSGKREDRVIDWNKAKNISIGMHSLSLENVLEISDIYLIKLKNKKE